LELNPGVVGDHEPDLTTARRIGAYTHHISGVISFRTTQAERRALRAEAQSRGFGYVSDLVRHKLGLPLGSLETAPIPAMDAIDRDVEHAAVARALHVMIDRLDTHSRQLTAIAKHVGAPRESERAGRSDVPVNIGWQPQESRPSNGAVELPPGFYR
jgi:hypothetical protein